MAGINFMEDETTEISGTLLVNGKLRFPSQNLTIASGQITPTQSYIIVTGEGGVADDLTSIHGAIQGDVIFVRIIDGGATVTLKDGVGNLAMAGDFALTSSEDSIMFICKSLGVWNEVSRSNNG